MNVFAKFDEIPSMILEVIKETKRYGHTDGRSDNIKTVCGGYNKISFDFYDRYHPNYLAGLL